MTRRCPPKRGEKKKRLKLTVNDYRTGRVSQNLHLTDSHKWEVMLHVVHCCYNEFNNTTFEYVFHTGFKIKEGGKQRMISETGTVKHLEEFFIC